MPSIFQNQDRSTEHIVPHLTVLPQPGLSVSHIYYGESGREELEEVNKVTDLNPAPVTQALRL